MWYTYDNSVFQNVTFTPKENYDLALIEQYLGLNQADYMNADSNYYLDGLFYCLDCWGGTTFENINATGNYMFNKGLFYFS